MPDVEFLFVENRLSIFFVKAFNCVFAASTLEKTRNTICKETFIVTSPYHLKQLNFLQVS